MRSSFAAHPVAIPIEVRPIPRIPASYRRRTGSSSCRAIPEGTAT